MSAAAHVRLCGRLVRAAIAIVFFIFMRFAWPFLDFHAHEPWGVAAYHKFNAFFIISGCIAVFVAMMAA